MLATESNTEGKTLSGLASLTNKRRSGTCILDVNPERFRVSVHPYTKLQNLAIGSHSLTNSVRRYFPVKGKKWVFRDSSWNSLAMEVGRHFFQLENWLNPNRHEFDDPRRCDAWQITGIDPFKISSQQGLLECLGTLVRRYGVILKHYGVAEQISSKEDESLLWWWQRGKSIEPDRLQDLDDVAEVLEEIIVQEDCFSFLDRRRPRGVPSLLSTDDGEAQLSEDIVNGRCDTVVVATHEYLGITVDEDRLTVGRDGYHAKVHFAGKKTLWVLFKALFNFKDKWYPKKTLANNVQHDLGGKGSSTNNNAVEGNISRLRKLLEPIGIKVEQEIHAGYRLRLNRVESS